MFATANGVLIGAHSYKKTDEKTKNVKTVHIFTVLYAEKEDPADILYKEAEIIRFVTDTNPFPNLEKNYNVSFTVETKRWGEKTETRYSNLKVVSAKS